jgi:hypothetical protein
MPASMVNLIMVVRMALPPALAKQHDDVGCNHQDAQWRPLLHQRTARATYLRVHWGLSSFAV